MEIGTRVRASREWIDKNPTHEPVSKWSGTFKGVCDNGMVKVLWDFDQFPANHQPEFIEAIPPGEDPHPGAGFRPPAAPQTSPSQDRDFGIAQDHQLPAFQEKPQPEPPKPPKKKWHERLKSVLADAGNAIGEAMFGRSR